MRNGLVNLYAKKALIDAWFCVLVVARHHFNIEFVVKKLIQYRVYYYG